MSERSVVHNTFVIERSFEQSPRRVFKAFADRGEKRRWFAESESFETQQYGMDFRVGGAEDARYRMNEKTPLPGSTISYKGTYLDIVPEERIVTVSAMSLREHPISATLVTFEFLPQGEGTKLVCTHQGVFFEGSDGPERRRGGWERLFDQLERQLAAGDRVLTGA